MKRTPIKRPAPRLLGTMAMATLALLAARPAAAIDLGDASVVSQQGQRLRVALTYGSAPDERVPVTRFSVVSVRVPDGYMAPSPETFTISKPDHRNLVFLQSQEPVNAPSVQLLIRVANDDSPQTLYSLTVPARHYAQAESLVRAPVRHAKHVRAPRAASRPVPVAARAPAAPAVAPAATMPASAASVIPAKAE